MIGAARPLKGSRMKTICLFKEKEEQRKSTGDLKRDGYEGEPMFDERPWAYGAPEMRRYQDERDEKARY